jgi:hypothetical protein
MELPVYANGPAPQGVGLAQTMSHFMPTNYRELSEFFVLLLCQSCFRCFVVSLFRISISSCFLCQWPNAYPIPNLNMTLD